MPDRELASQPGGSEPWQGVVIVSFLMGFMIFGSLFAFGWLADRMSCVEMPNGFLIGRATVFSSLVGWAPDIAIRYPDGRLFSRGDISVDFWDAEGLGGTFVRSDGNGGFDYLDNFVFLNHAGLVTQEKQPELFGQYFEQKNSEWKEKGRNGANLYSVYSRLMENHKNRRSWCKTDWSLPEATE